jgi:peptidoglycan/LPS O-acetylase OafA/YrhL
VVLMLFATNVWPRAMLASSLFLAAYLAAAIGAGWLSYRYFERPTRAWLRDAPLRLPKPAKAAL